MASLVASTARFTVVALLMIVLTIGFIDNHNSMAYAQSCNGYMPDIPGLINFCNKYVQKSGPKIPPSAQCCAVARKSNMVCLCKQVSPDLEKYFSIEKAIYIGQYCGVSLQNVATCGSYTIPHA